MINYRVPFNTTAIDVSFNLSGSLAGFPVVIYQLPTGTKIGFDTLPDMGQDVADIGQTWTPDLQDQTFQIDVALYNPATVRKGNFTTNLAAIEPAILYGQDKIRELLKD